MSNELSHDLAPENVLHFMTSPREGRRKGATATIVNEATGNRITVRFRKPKGFKAVLVDLMTGSDNEESFSFIGTLAGEQVRISPKQRTDAQKAHLAAKVINWTIAHAEADDLRTVRVLHSGSCGRCGRKLTVPESIDSGLGPECAKHRKVA
tara:strand:- start:358 stop:813 length:456 start_codon:yes stop_codon:yes gene_type:complete